jgi:hypothetical protein
MFKIKEWVPGVFPVPIFQTWCCTSSAVTSDVSDFDDLRNAGLMPQMLECVCDNLRLNRVGIDCIHYLFNDDACREFLAMTFPTDLVYAYDRLIPTAFKADLWRYCILYMFGGVYMDIKYKWNSDTVTIRDVIEGVPPPYDGSQGCVGGGGGTERAQATSERAQATSERAQASEEGEGGCVVVVIYFIYIYHKIK